MHPATVYRERMVTRADHVAAVSTSDDAAVIAYLGAHSGLPGPRGNLELMAAFVTAGRPELIRSLVGSDDEYLASCAATGIGRLVIEAAPSERQSLIDLAHDQATDERWRVREGAAMALQWIGDHDPALLRSTVTAWAADQHPLVRRAAIAGVCEPRLLADAATARCALAACATTTDSITALPSAARKDPDVRVLRQALAYCWSVAVAGLPAEGLPMFAELRTNTDADVVWIVRQNLGKTRLKKLLTD